jgi:hypothetical protein
LEAREIAPGRWRRLPAHLERHVALQLGMPRASMPRPSLRADGCEDFVRPSLAPAAMALISLILDARNAVTHRFSDEAN